MNDPIKCMYQRLKAMSELQYDHWNKNKKKKSNDKRTKSTYVYFLFFMGSTLVNAIGMIVMNFFV